MVRYCEKYLLLEIAREVFSVKWVLRRGVVVAVRDAWESSGGKSSLTFDADYVQANLQLSNFEKRVSE